MVSSVSLLPPYRTATDAVVCRGGSLEEVMVSSREIAASSMQLVMASRVKAEPGSEALGNLNQAAKTISTITGNLVATAESCRDKVSHGQLVTLSFDYNTNLSSSAMAVFDRSLLNITRTECC